MKIKQNSLRILQLNRIRQAQSIMLKPNLTIFPIGVNHEFSYI